MRKRMGEKNHTKRGEIKKNIVCQHLNDNSMTLTIGVVCIPDELTNICQYTALINSILL